MIGIIDYGVGNIGSLTWALKKQGLSVIVSNDIEVLKQCKGLILPGVGAFRDGIGNIEKYNLKDFIIAFAETGKPIVGICLGMQLLYEIGRENGEYQGIGLLKGSIEKIDGERLPHMGWNELVVKREDPLVAGLKASDHVYYVHSYFALSSGEEVVAYSDYYNQIPGIVRSDNIIGFQFHPEKSGAVGEQLIRNLKEVFQ
ncbi:MAG: imidazole glycerol phosphate synthase subunit HisH [Clostridia bacterium]|nr:imidazole glycerol phosphate synthase subunit HisH [Clostridia bacterium]